MKGGKCWLLCSQSFGDLMAFVVTRWGHGLGDDPPGEAGQTWWEGCDSTAPGHLHRDRTQQEEWEHH